MLEAINAVAVHGNNGKIVKRKNPSVARALVKLLVWEVIKAAIIHNNRRRLVVRPSLNVPRVPVTLNVVAATKKEIVQNPNLVVHAKRVVPVATRAEQNRSPPLVADNRVLAAKVETNLIHFPVARNPQVTIEGIKAKVSLPGAEQGVRKKVKFVVTLHLTGSLTTKLIGTRL